MQIHGVQSGENRMYSIYSRKSKHIGKGESIENQVEMCKDYLCSYVKDVDEKEIVVYEDEGFSVKNFGRPMFKRMALLNFNIFNKTLMHKQQKIVLDHL